MCVCVCVCVWVWVGGCGWVGRWVGACVPVCLCVSMGSLFSCGEYRCLSVCSCPLA